MGEKSIKIRRKWRRNPTTRVKGSDKTYRRPREKRRVKKTLKREVSPK